MVFTDYKELRNFTLIFMMLGMGGCARVNDQILVPSTSTGIDGLTNSGSTFVCPGETQSLTNACIEQLFTSPPAFGTVTIDTQLATNINTQLVQTLSTNQQVINIQVIALAMPVLCVFPMLNVVNTTSGQTVETYYLYENQASSTGTVFPASLAPFPPLATSGPSLLYWCGEPTKTSDTIISSYYGGDPAYPNLSAILALNQVPVDATDLVFINQGDLSTFVNGPSQFSGSMVILPLN